jgi:hybrid cluster-associated redox disulfide protein
MMQLINFSPRSSVADLLARVPQAVDIFLRHRMSCVGCSMSSFETLEDAAQIYGIPLETLMAEISAAVVLPQPTLTPQPEKTLETTYTFFPNIRDAVADIPQDSIVSRTVYRDDHLKAILFAFAPGQELSEHTASVPAIIQIIEGECDLTVGQDKYTVSAGAWVRMQPNLPHSLYAKTPMKMLLLMLP